MKNFLLSLLCVIAWVSAHAQDDRWSVSAENTLSFSNATSPRVTRNDDAYRAAYNAFLRTEFRMTEKLSLTAGFGYLQTREYVNIESGFTPYELESLKSHHYVVAPLGFTYAAGSIFIRPEIGIGYNTANTSRDYHSYVDASNVRVETSGKSKDTYNLDQVNKMTYPLFLTIGTEIPVSSFRLVMGLQGYYTLNTIGEKYTNQRHAYGFGTTVGLKF